MGLLSLVRNTCWYSSTGGHASASRLMFITSVRDNGGKRRRSQRTRVWVAAGLPLGDGDADDEGFGSGVGAAPEAVGDAAAVAAGVAVAAASRATIWGTVLAPGDVRTEVGDAPVADADADALGEADGDGDGEGDGDDDDDGTHCADVPPALFDPEAIT